MTADRGRPGEVPREAAVTGGQLGRSTPAVADDDREPDAGPAEPGRAGPGSRRLAWAGILLVVIVALVIGAVDDGGPRTPADRVRAIGQTVACPQCDGQAVADSNATSAINIRAEIARQVQAGRSDDEIRASIAASFGQEVLLTPSRSGFAGLVWFLPVLALVLSLAALAAQFRRWRHAPTAVAVSDADRDLVERARHR